MAHCSMTNKAVLDIQDTVAELKRVFFIENTIINDDSSALHRLEENLEFVLLFGLKEKPGVFGGKLSYWDFISACLSSSKLHHQGLKFVKSYSELKSSLGRGRAFLRFCLMQNCLADTLQSCFLNQRTSRDFYLEHSLPLQHKLWSSLISCLYDLNEINFDLNPQHAELDVSWPLFSRKLFSSSENKISGKNLNSNVTHFSAERAQNLVDNNSESEANVLCLQTKCEALEKEIFCTVHDENESKNYGLVTENLDEFILQDILDNDGKKQLLTSQNFAKDSSKYIEKEFNFNVKDTQCVCSSNPKTELLEEKNCDFSFSSDIQSLQTVNHQCSDSYELLDSNTQKIKSGLMFIASEKFINYVNDPPDFHTDISIDTLQSKAKTFKESHALKLSDSTSKLIFEIKGIIDNLSNSVCIYTNDSEITSNFTRLKIALECLEISHLEDFKKLMECEIHKQQSVDLSDFLKSLALKQEAITDSLSEKINSSLKENESLYENMKCLKDRLHSYGLLKLETDGNVNMQSSLPVNAKSADDLNWNVELFDCASKESLHILKESLSKLCTMNMQAMSLQLWSHSSNNLSNNLISRVQDQEIHMKGITKELEEAHHLLSVMRNQHKKLQSAENIIKYDLQEKRKLLTRLKQQLESTHDDCNIVKMKNSKSEVECKSLRKEFALRNKQTSEESGFVDDKGLEDNCVIMNVAYDHNVIPNIPNKEVSSNINDVESKYILKKNRLQMLEEQCKLLCSNLVNSSKKRQEIDSRLESWCEAIENSHKVPEIEKSTNVIDINQDCESGTAEYAFESTLDSGSEIDSSLLSSGIGSVNSDFLCIPTNPLESTNMCCSLETSDVKYLEPSTISNEEHYKSEILLDDTSLRIDCNVMSTPVCKTKNFKNFEIMEDPFLGISIESLEGIEDCSNHSQDVFSPKVNSLKYIENEHQGTFADTTCKRTFLETDISKLCEENTALKGKCQELEKNSIVLLNQLVFKSHQLKLTETAKEQEITALQFQLNSEILKYESALKEFSTNNDNLNEMKHKVNDQEELILALEEALAEIQSERVNEKDHLWEQLQDIQLALAAREEECILLSADLEKLEDFKKYCLSDREIMENEISHLQSDSKGLQKKIIKLLKEKDILWKRNDHLTFLQKIQIDDRWMNDHEVSQCLGCRSNFSFLLRKHHCRQCGRIFCFSCSNNWLLTASSKKQIRICNECYKQHLEIKKAVQRNSNVQCCEDSDDEAAIDNASLYLNRSFCSANRPSIGDSVISLPVLQVTNLTQKRYFTSVPELYIASEDNDIANTKKLKVTESDENCVLLIKAGEESELPVLNEKHSISLRWKFLPNNEAIPVSLIYENPTCLMPQRAVLHQSACETESVIHLTLPGLYKLHFDNRSRSTSMSVHYTFKNEISNEQNIHI